jgi:hypothetical protein
MDTFSEALILEWKGGRVTEGPGAAREIGSETNPLLVGGRRQPAHTPSIIERGGGVTGGTARAARSASILLERRVPGRVGSKASTSHRALHLYGESDGAGSEKGPRPWSFYR